MPTAGKDLYDLASQESFVSRAIIGIEGSILIICLFFWECQVNVLAVMKATNQCDFSEPEGVQSPKLQMGPQSAFIWSREHVK